MEADGERERERERWSLLLAFALAQAHLGGGGLAGGLGRGLGGGCLPLSLEEAPHAGALQGVGLPDGVPRSVERGLHGSEDPHAESVVVTLTMMKHHID